MEDVRILQRKRQQEDDVGENRKDDKQSFDNNDKSGELPRTLKFNHYTALNALRVKVLEEALMLNFSHSERNHLQKTQTKGRTVISIRTTNILQKNALR